MQVDQTQVILTSSSVKFPKQHNCPNCNTPIEQATHNVAIEILMVQMAKVIERQDALALENEELKKMLQESKDYGLENSRRLKIANAEIEKTTQKLNAYKMQTVKEN